MTEAMIKTLTHELKEGARGPVQLCGYMKNVVILYEEQDMERAKNELVGRGYHLVRMPEQANRTGRSVEDVFMDIWHEGHYLVILQSSDAYGSMLVCDLKTA